MPTRDDIEDGERIDIRVKVLSKLDCTTEKMADRLLLRDTGGNEFPLAIWGNNSLTDFTWEIGRWYQLENAKGNQYQGKKSLNGSYSLEAKVIDPPLKENREKNETQLFDSLQDSIPYLSLFPFSRDFAELSAYEYRIESDGGFDEDPMDATYRLASYLRTFSDAAVTVAGVMSIITTDRLTATLPDPFTLTDESSITLYAADQSDNERIVELLQQLVKRGIDDTEYKTGRINQIRTREPVITGADGLFEACIAYSARIEVLPSGNAFIGIEVSHHTRSQVTADEYIDRINASVEELIDTHVEHDPETYATSGSGKLKGIANKRFTDPIPDFGNQSLAKWYEQKDRISDELVAKLRAENPQLVKIQYNPRDDDTSVHVPQLLRVSPRKEIVKQVAPNFHRKWDRAAKMLPDKRFRKAIEFVNGLDTIPEVNTEIEPSPIGPTLSFMSTETGQEDNLRFGGDRSTGLPKQGLSRYGVYRRPSSFRVHYLVPEQYSGQFDYLRDKLEDRLASWECEPETTSYGEYQLGSAIEYSNAAASIDNVDAVLVVVPEPSNEFIRDGTIDDPYPEFKKALGKQSIPSQMVRADNLDNKWVVQNTALGLVAGAGGVPWRVDEMPGDVDCFVGLDATRDPDTGQFLGASANVVLADGTVFVSKTQSIQSGETFDDDAVIDILKDVHREYVRAEGEPPESMVIHRDGRLFENSAEILKPFEASGIEIDILDIRKSGAPRAAIWQNEEFQVDQKGRLFIAQDNDFGFLSTTGRPEFDEDDELGTPRTLRVVRRAGNTPMATLLKQVYWLSESHVGSAQRSIRLPVTTYYADACAEHARKGFLTNGELIRGVPYI